MDVDIYIVRHGQTDYNLAGYYQGCLLNPSLNEYGREQAKRIKEKLIKHNLNIDYYFSSPLKRAYETIQIIKHNDDINMITILPDLIEGNFGIIEGHTEEEIKKRFSEEFKKWKDLDNLDFKFNGGESKKEIGERINSIVTHCGSISYSLFSNHNILITTHSAAIRCLLLYKGIKEEEIPFNKIYHFKFIKNRISDLEIKKDIIFIESF